MRALTPRLPDQRGSVLIIVVIVMLVFLVMGASFVLLARLESVIGINEKEGVQALALAEAALEHGRDQARALAGTAPDFSAPVLVGNANNGSMLITDVVLGDGTYSVRIDNDCAAAVRSTLPADTGCGPHTDSNQRVALTAWATRGIGRARVRAWMEMSNPWKHVCYNGDGVLCTQEPEANDNATVNPSDPNQGGGPATGPLPVPNNLVCGASIRRTAVALAVALGASDCVVNPYYDLALNTACPQCSPARIGCADPAPHAGNSLDPCPDSGMVFYGPLATASTFLHGADILISSTGGAEFRCAGDHTGGAHPGGLVFPCLGTTNAGVVVYVMGKVKLGNNGEVNGTVVVHGDGTGGSSGPPVDMSISGQSGIWSIGSCAPPATPSGYPLALLIYDPSEITLPQNTFTNISNSNSEIHGMVYSAGEVSFNPISVDGGVIAWKTYFQNAASAATYNECYGRASPPPGFSTPPGTQTVAVDRRTWSQCKLYSTTESTAPTSC